MSIPHNLFAESIAALSKETLTLAGPYNKDNTLSDELLENETDDKEISDNILRVYTANKESLFSACTEPNFDKFSVILKTAFNSKANSILPDYPDVQKKLAELVSLAYLMSANKEARFKIYSNIDTSKQVATAIMDKLRSSIRMKFLRSSAKFKNKLEIAITSSVFRENTKKPEVK